MSKALGPGFAPIADYRVPDGWMRARLGELATIRQGGALGYTKSDYESTGVCAYSAAGQDGWVPRAEYRNTDGVVLSSIGANCGRVFRASGSWTTMANVQAIVPSDQLDYRFLHHRVNREDYWERSGSAQPFIKPSSVGKSWLLLPPREEQWQISEILDSVDDHIALLERAVVKMKKVREGLIRDLLWRPDVDQVRPLGSLAEIGAGVTLGSEPSGPGTVTRPYLRVANVQDGHLDLKEIKRVRVRRSELDRFELRPGDVLMNEGGDADKLGRGAVWEGEVPGCLHQNHVFRVRCRQEVLNPQYLSLVTGSAIGKQYFLAASKQTTNLATINSRQIKQFPVPLRSLPRQIEIVEAVDACTVRIQAEVNELGKVRLLKAGLVDDLLSGRVRVPAGATS